MSDYKRKFTDLSTLLPEYLKNEANVALMQNLFNKFITKDESEPLLGYVGDKINLTDTYIGQIDSDRLLNALLPVLYTKQGNEEYVFTFMNLLHKLSLIGVDLTKMATWGQAQSFNLVFPVNLDKFCNYQKYYWYGHLVTGVTPPAYNPKYTLPEYIVMSTGVVNDWSADNYWAHEDDLVGLGYSTSTAYQALRPIIEYNSGLELNDATLNGVPCAPATVSSVAYTQTKTSFGQYPLFNLYLLNGVHSGLISPIVSYAEGNIYDVDPKLLKRIVVDKYGDYTIKQSLSDPSTGKLYMYKESSVLKSIMQPGPIISPRYAKMDSTGNVVDVDPATVTDGAWLVPDQMFYNINHEVLNEITFPDLQVHFGSIIGAQTGFYGNPFGNNNFRTLGTVDLGLGGNIKDFNSEFDVFLGLLNQEDSSPLTIIDFASEQYAQSLNFVTEFVLQNIADYVTQDKFNVSDATTYNTLLADLKTALSQRESSSIFSDTTSGLAFWPATLPYLGLATGVAPSIELDNELGYNVIVHHDGHRSKAAVFDATLAKSIAGISYTRYNNASIPGYVGATPPARPYKNQFWYDTTNNVLKYYNVDAVGPIIYPVFNGYLWYDPVVDVLSSYSTTTSSWVVVADKTTPWTILNVEDVINVLTLMVENILYAGIPPVEQAYDIAALQTSQSTVFNTLLEKEFAKYGADNNVDLYATDFDPLNAFTWNYHNATFTNVAAGTARWYKIYEQYFGTARPNIEPWYLAGYTTEPTWWGTTYGATAGSGRLWTTQMWTDIKAGTVQDPGGSPPAWINKLAVDPSTDTLLPPYVSAIDPLSAEALITAIPTGINDTYVFNDYGPVELAWRKSIEYNYDLNKVAFIIDPVMYINDTWGDNLISVNSYDLNRQFGKKLNHKDIVLHGETITPESRTLNFAFSQNEIFTITATTITALGTIFSVNSNVRGFIMDVLTNVNTISTDGGITVLIPDNSVDFYVGDYFTVQYINGVQQTPVFTSAYAQPVPRTITFTSSQTELYTFTATANVSNLTDTVVTNFNGTIFSVVGSVHGTLANAYSGVQYTTPDITVTIPDNSIDYQIGDTFTVQITNNVPATPIFVPVTYKTSQGLNQWFVNLTRYNAVDLSISLTNSLLREWDIKLAYRFSGLINTQNLNIKSDNFAINSNDVNIVLKENRQISDTWLDAIRIQLVRKGEGIPIYQYVNTDSRLTTVPKNLGVDWVYRIETFNPDHPYIEYYDLDTAAASATFTALSKKHCLETWKKYKNKTTLVNQVTPFYITGIQNVVNFLFGYAMKLEEDGWVFNNDAKPEIDAITSRTKGWQLEAERFIDAQYQGIDAGFGIIMNPFQNKVWYSTPRGMVANMRKPAFSDIITSQTVYNALGETIKHDKLRVFRGDEITEIISDEIMGGAHLFVNEYEHIVIFNDYAVNKTISNLMYNPFLGKRINRMYINTRRQEVFNGRLSFGGHFLSDKTMKKNIDASVESISNLYDVDKMDDSDPATRNARALLGYEPKEYMKNLGLQDKTQFGFWRGLIQNKGSNLSIDAFLNSARFKSAKIDEYWAYKVAEYGDARQNNFPELKLYVDEAAKKYLKFQFLQNLTDIADTTFIGITNIDEDRWFSIDDFNSNLFFDGELINQLSFPSATAGTLYDLKVQDKYVFADELVVYNSADLTTVLVENTDYTFVNSTTIKFTNPGSYVVMCYAPSQQKFNPAKLIDYKDKVVIDDIPLWDPARGSYEPSAMEIINLISSKDPARYNYSTRTVNNSNYDTLRPWDDSYVGKIWWNVSNLGYVPYFDKKIFPDLNIRLAYWGAIADWASIDLYEWTESTVHPSNWETLVKSQEGDADISANDKASGIVTLKELYYRTRTWEQRPIAWKYSDVPGNVRDFAIPEVTNNALTVQANTYGDTLLIIENKRFSDYGLATGMKVAEYTASKPIGEAEVTGDEDNYITVTQDFLVNTGFINAVIAPISSSTVTSPIGSLALAFDTVGVDYYLRASVVNALTGTILSDKVQITDDTRLIVGTQSTDGYVVTFNFEGLGISVSGTTSGWSAVAGTTADTRMQAIGNAFNGLTGTLATSIPVKLNIPFSGTTLSNWISWNDPTDLVSDVSSPNNRWEPVLGDWTAVTNVAYALADIKASMASPFVTPEGVTYDKYYNTWGNWSLLTDTYQEAKYTSGTMAFTFTSTLSANSVSVFKNGLILKSTDYTISGSTVTLNTNPNEGDLVRVVNRKYAPTSSELAFDPTVKDDPSILTQYKYDYQYSVDTIRDSDGNIISTKYYFWVAKKNLATLGRSMSLTQAEALLKNLNRSFAVLQKSSIIEGKVASTDRTGYDQFITTGLNRIVTKEDTYKLRFTRDFILRDDPQNMNLKNVHAEWTLIRERQKDKIPVDLWNRLVDAACGQDLAGNPVPSDERVQYDSRHNTRTRYGFASGQALVSQDLAVESILYAILNTTVTIENYAAGDQIIPDPISFLDFSQSATWFVTPQSTRQTLNDIWNQAKPSQINEIFFTVFYNALAENYEFSDIIKTSMVAAHSIRLLESDSLGSSLI